MSDSGGCAEKIHQPGIDDWHAIGQSHTYESYGKPWANYGNTPFREYKHYPPSPSDDVHRLAGRSLMPAFRGETIERNEIFWKHEANRALRQGKWKLFAKGAAGPWNEIARSTHVYPLLPELPGLLYGERAIRSS